MRDARAGSPFCAIHMEQEVRSRAGPRTPEWTTDDIIKAAVGFGVLAAIVLFRIRR